MEEKKLVLNLEKKSWGTQKNGFSLYSNTCKHNDEILDFLKTPGNVRWILDEDSFGQNHFYGFYEKDKELEQKFKANTQILLSSFWPIIGHYKKKFGYNTFKTEDPEFLKIGKTKQIENYEITLADFETEFSIIHFLNDDYKGGELDFSDYKVKIKPEKNQTIFLNSKNVKYNISPIESGEQYVFVNSYKRKRE